MQGKKQLGIVVALLVILLLATNLHFMGCAGTQPGKQKLSLERQKAIEDSLLNVHKRQLALLWSLGYEPYKQGNYEKAKKYFKQVAEKDTTGIYGRILYQALGTTYLQLNHPDSAEWAYKLGIDRNPDNPYSYKALGYIYRAQGRTEEGIDVYQRLIELEPDSASGYRYLGEMYLNADEHDKAIEAYQKVIQLAPDDKKSQQILDNLLAQTGDIDAVISQRESMVEQFPEDIKLRLDLAQSYFRAGLFEKSIGQLKIVTSKEPDNILALEILGESYQQTDKYNAAITTYNQILKIRPDDKKNLCNLAMSYTSLGRYTTAMRQVRKAFSIDSKYGLAYLTRGMIYETSAEKCVEQHGGKVAFDEKLVYKMAYDEYVKAKQDLEWKSDAERRIRYLETLIPTREDYFMHKNQTTPSGVCYEWIQ